MDLTEVELRIFNEPTLKAVSEEAEKEGLNLYLVGGALRDYLLGLSPKDFDLVIEGSDEQLRVFLRKLALKLKASYFLLGKKDHVYRMVKGEEVLDFSIICGKDIEEDLRRRDFTVNSLAYSFRDKSFYFHPDSLKDLKDKRLRTISPETFFKDPLRILRAFRYMATLGFTIPLEIKEEILRANRLLTEVSPERILGELEGIFLSDAPDEAIFEMAKTRVIDVLFPQLSSLRELEQGPFHIRDAFWHSITVTVEALRIARDPAPLRPLSNKEDKLALAYSALFHDLGKPETLSIDEKGTPHFYGHEVISKGKVLTIAERYPFSKGLSQKIIRLVENHMYVLNLSQSNPTDRAIRKLITRMGESLETALILAWAEWREKGKDEKAYGQFLKRVIALKENLQLLQPFIRGQDLLDLGLRPGPIIGQILRKVHELQVEGVLRTKEEALEFVKQNYLTKGEIWPKE